MHPRGMLLPGVAGIMAVLSGCAPLSAERAYSVQPVQTQPATRPVADSAKPTLPVLNEESTLEDYLAYAALNNAGLQAAFNRWKAALERVPQVRALPDPKFTYAYFIQEVETRVGPQQQKLRLAQTFPWFGKLQLRGDVAMEEANAARQRYEAEKLKLFYRVKDVYYEYYYLGRAIAVVRANRDLMKYLEAVARTRYKAGATGHPDVIRAQVELGKLDDQLRTLMDLREPIVARLNAALNRPVGADLPWPKAAPEEQIEATDEQILSWLRASSPELKALEYQIAKQRHAIELAKKDYFPDITLAVEYTDIGTIARKEGQGLRAPFAQRSAVRLGQGMGDALDAINVARSFLPGDRPGEAGRDAWVVSATLNVPIWYEKYRAGECEARARHLAALRSWTDRARLLSSRIKQVLYEFRDAARKIDLYKDTLIPKAKQTLKATEAAFRAGQATFLDLVDAERVLLEFELSYERALANHAQRLAELEMLVGRELPRRQEASVPEDGRTRAEAQARSR